MCVTYSLTDICCEGQVSVCMEPINGCSSRTPLPAFICCTQTHWHSQNPSMIVQTKSYHAHTRLVQTHTHPRFYATVCSDKSHKYICMHTWKQPGKLNMHAGSTHVWRRNLALDSQGTISCYNSGLTGPACQGCTESLAGRHVSAAEAHCVQGPLC